MEIVIKNDSLTFDPLPHEYRWIGEIVPGVTGILENVGIIDYGYLSNETRAMALARGSAVHSACHFDDEGDLVENDAIEPIMGYVRGWRKFRKETQFTPRLIEFRSYNPSHGFAGCLDREGDTPLWKLPAIVDIKTNEAPIWTAYQTAAYASFFPSPRAYMRLAVELHKDGRYHVEPYYPQDWYEHFEVFISAQRVMRAKEFCNPWVKLKHETGRRVA